MDDFVVFVIMALALVLVIEGLIYALFPDTVRKMMAAAIMMPVSRLRLIGGIMAIIGAFLVLILNNLTGGAGF